MHDDPEPTIDDVAQEWFQREPIMLDTYADYLRDMADAESVGDQPDDPPADFEPPNCYVPGLGWRVV